MAYFTGLPKSITKKSIKKVGNSPEYLCEPIIHNNVLETNILTKKFNAIEGGETTLYYLKLLFKGKPYYKIGVTLNSVKKRYKVQDFKIIDKILYEKKLTHANKIEKAILKEYNAFLFPLAILSSGHSEVFDSDVLNLDI